VSSDSVDVVVVDQLLSPTAVGRALGDLFTVASGRPGIDELPSVLEEQEPDALLMGPSMVSDASRISSLMGGSLVLLGNPGWQSLEEASDNESSAEATELLRLAVRLACASPPCSGHD
jgi:hypothetical protein